MTRQYAPKHETTTAKRGGSRRAGKLGHVPVSSANGEPGHVPVLNRRLSEIHPSPENDKLYRPVTAKDPEIRSLADSIRQHGVKEPLVITDDGYILSGHRRYAAARIARLTVVPCRVEPIRREDDPDRFIVLLREYNRQREKSLDEKLREELVSVNPVTAHASLLEHRREKSLMVAPAMKIVGVKSRCAISAAKAPFLAAIRRVLDDRKDFWPLSDRQIHYALLNAPPLIHASKAGSTYANTLQCYKALTDLLTRARLVGQVPMHAIADETRPVETWGAHRDPRTFIRQELNNFLKGYWRDRMQSQPNHIEIIGEKNTVAPMLRPVAGEYCIPLTTGRGYCSLPPRVAIASRHKASGKSKLILLILSDFDPDGDEIAASFARSMRDDFGIADIHPVRVALTPEQVEQYHLPPVMKAKVESTHHGKFVERHGNDDVFELEALPPATLQEVLRRAIDSVIDVDLYNAEVAAEESDAAFLEAARNVACESMKGIDWNAKGVDS